MESDYQTIVLDAGAWNFRLSLLGNQRDLFHCFSRIGTTPTGEQNLVSDSYSFIDEKSYKWTSPFIKGVLVNFPTFDFLFQKGLTHQGYDKASNNSRNLTLAYIRRPFQPLRASCHFLEYVFELEGMGGVSGWLPAELKLPGLKKGNGIMLDLGHSFCHTIPIYKGEVLSNSIKRLDIGGKILTKCLSDCLSLTQLQVRDHFYLVNGIREVDSSLTSKHILRNYSLPDYEIRKAGSLINTDEPITDRTQYLKIQGEAANISKALFFPEMFNN